MRTMSSSQINALAAAAAQGSVRAFQALVDHFQPLLIWLATSQRLDESKARLCVRNVFFKAWEKLQPGKLLDPDEHCLYAQIAREMGESLGTPEERKCSVQKIKNLIHRAREDLNHMGFKRDEGVGWFPASAATTVRTETALRHSSSSSVEHARRRSSTREPSSGWR